MRHCRVFAGGGVSGESGCESSLAGQVRGFPARQRRRMLCGVL